MDPTLALKWYKVFYEYLATCGEDSESVWSFLSPQYVIKCVEYYFPRGSGSIILAPRAGPLSSCARSNSSGGSSEWSISVSTHPWRQQQQPGGRPSLRLVDWPEREEVKCSAILHHRRSLHNGSTGVSLRHHLPLARAAAQSSLGWARAATPPPPT